MNIGNIKIPKGSRRSSKRKGQGPGSGNGKTAGRGHKGQRSRSGASRGSRVGFEGGQMPLYRRLPKRGFNNPFSKHYAELNIGALQGALNAGKIDAKKPITESALLKSGLVRRVGDGVRLLGKGVLTTKLEIIVTSASKGAIASVEKIGGNVTLPQPKTKPDGKGKRRDKISAERKAIRAAEQISE